MKPTWVTVQNAHVSWKLEPKMEGDDLRERGGRVCGHHKLYRRFTVFTACMFLKLRVPFFAELQSALRRWRASMVLRNKAIWLHETQQQAAEDKFRRNQQHSDLHQVYSDDELMKQYSKSCICKCRRQWAGVFLFCFFFPRRNKVFTTH